MGSGGAVSALVSKWPLGNVSEVELDKAIASRCAPQQQTADALAKLTEYMGDPRDNGGDSVLGRLRVLELERLRTSEIVGYLAGELAGDEVAFNLALRMLAKVPQRETVANTRRAAVKLYKTKALHGPVLSARDEVLSDYGVPR